MKDWKSAKAAHEKGWNEISYIKTLKEWRKVYAEDEENKKKLRWIPVSCVQQMESN
jgi:hypothetical protein